MGKWSELLRASAGRSELTVSEIVAVCCSDGDAAVTWATNTEFDVIAALAKLNWSELFQISEPPPATVQVVPS